MRFNQIMEADAGKAQQSAVIARLERAGGDVVGRATNDVGDVAVIGVNGMSKGKVYFVIYPDGTMDRFDSKSIVIYRTGYTGPAINDPKESARRIQQSQWEKEQRAEQRADQQAQKRQDKIRDQRDKLMNKYSNMVIPPEARAICDAAENAFDAVMNMIGPDLRSGVASYGDEAEAEETKYYDPAVILDMVSDRMHDYVNGHDPFGHDIECTPEQWKAFDALPIKIQLKVATPFAGSMFY